MVGKFGEVQFMDWGLAKVLVVDEAATLPSEIVDDLDRPSVIDTGDESNSDADKPRTRVGSIMGTPAYMSPEQANGKTRAINERSDAFTLGAILFEMITGRPIYLGPSMVALQQAIQGDVSSALATLEQAGVEEPIFQLIADCLAYKPSDRPRNAGVIVSRLNEYLNGV